VAPGAYRPTTVQLASGSSLVAFTDGLVERRGENLDLGLDRLVRAADGDAATVEELLAALTATLGPDGAADDVAVLAFRWTSPEEQPDGGEPSVDRVG
jgi:serine phosphatase RsbU (regulator of sigma subunit)